MQFMRLGPYIVSLEYIHGIMQAKPETKDGPYYIYITYTDKSCVSLEFSNKELCDTGMNKLAEALNAT